MGLFDTVKLKANALAADAERAGKVTAAQARTVVLQNEIRKAERELGHSAFALIDSGEIAHPDLDAASARLRDARQTLKDKEAEIEALRSRAVEANGAPAADSAETVAPQPETAAPIAEEPPAATAAAPVATAAGAVQKPAAKKPAAKKRTATKRTPKKPPAAKAPSAADA